MEKEGINQAESKSINIDRNAQKMSEGTTVKPS